MAVNEQIVTGRKFRKLVDEATKLWQRISFWTKASDVEFDDGSTAETKMGAINGITDSLASTSSNIAASAKALSQLNNKLTFPDGTDFYLDIKDGERGYNSDPARGADTFSPFSNYNVKASAAGRTPTSASGTSISITVPKNVKRGLLLCVSTGWASEMTQSQPSGSGIKKIVSKHNRTVSGTCSNITAIYECEFNENGSITLSFQHNNNIHTGYPTGQLILLA